MSNDKLLKEKNLPLNYIRKKMHRLCPGWMAPYEIIPEGLFGNIIEITLPVEGMVAVEFFGEFIQLVLVVVRHYSLYKKYFRENVFQNFVKS